MNSKQHGMTNLHTILTHSSITKSKWKWEKCGEMEKIFLSTKWNVSVRFEAKKKFRRGTKNKEVFIVNGAGLFPNYYQSFNKFWHLPYSRTLSIVTRMYPSPYQRAVDDRSQKHPQIKSLSLTRLADVTINKVYWMCYHRCARLIFQRFDA